MANKSVEQMMTQLKEGWRHVITETMNEDACRLILKENSTALSKKAVCMLDGKFALAFVNFAATKGKDPFAPKVRANGKQQPPPAQPRSKSAARPKTASGAASPSSPEAGWSTVRSPHRKTEGQPNWRWKWRCSFRKLCQTQHQEMGGPPYDGRLLPGRNH